MLAQLAPAPPAHNGTLPPEALEIAVIRLAFGGTAGREWRDRDWSLLLEEATRQRCAPLIWLRAAPVIRQLAPPEIAARWRARALAAGELAHAQADEVADLVTMLADRGTAPVVLKGLPLAVMLYGDASARPSFDIDLFIPAAARTPVHDLLRESGWHHLTGIAPAEGTYRRIAASRVPHLEIHSSLLDDGLLAHVACPPPDAAPIEVARHTLPAQSGDTLEIFLAVHLAKHSSVPLLWWIDFATCWERLDTAARVRIRTRAETFGLARFIEWAEQGVASLAEIRGDDDVRARSAISALHQLHRSRNTFRVMRLVEGLPSRGRVILGWVAPLCYRSSPRALVVTLAARVSARIMSLAGLRRRTPSRGEYDRTSGRAMPLHPAAVASLVRESTASGSTVWIRARGTSMLPTIPRVADVLIGPVTAAGLDRGDVVLV
ncbi:MAG: nucleotidyltransferase family protein, partial [Gemmatimonadaceae bacterium]